MTAGASTIVIDEIHRGEYHSYHLGLEVSPDKHVATVIFDRVSDEAGGIWCEIAVSIIGHGEDEIWIIPPSRTNLMNATRSGWRTHTDELEQRYSSVTWYDTFRELVRKTIIAHRDGDVVVEMKPTVNPERFHPFALEPLVADRGVTVLYGEGGMGKSTIALAAAIAVASGYPIYGHIPHRTGPVVYFDYEDDSLLHNIRLARLLNGFKNVRLAHPIYHKSLIAKVTSSQASMRRLVAETGAVMAILDSVGMGRGGDAHKPEETIRMFRALRSLGIPVLALDHVSHATRRDKSQDRLEDLAPYGSIYTVNSARLLWGGVIAPSSSELVRNIQLINTKANHVRRQNPFGITMAFGSDGNITFKVVDQVWDEFNMTVWERIQAVLLMSDEFLSVKDLAERCEVSRATIRTELHRHASLLEEMYKGKEKRVRLLREEESG